MDTDLLPPAALNDDDWPRLLARCEAALDLDGSARACKAFERPREVKTAQDLLRLALSYGPGGRSLRAAAGWAEESGLASLSDVAVMNRLRKAADWLGVVAGALLAQRAPPGAGARALRIVDARVICAPGRTDGWRLHTADDPVGQRFLLLELTDTRGAERLDRAPVTADEIRLGDRAYATRPEGVRRLTAEPGDYVVRVSWRGLHWLEPAGGRFDVLAFLERAGPAPVSEAAVLVGRAKTKDFAPVPARLIAVRLPPEPVGRARRRARKSSHKAGDRIQPGTLGAAGFVLLLTSLDPHAYPAERVAGLYRLRWQVELAFTRLKSLLRLDRLPAKDPQLARAWLYAHLIGALLIEDLIRDEVPDSPPWGPGWLAAQRVAVAAGGPVRRGPRGGRARPGLPQAAA